MADVKRRLKAVKGRIEERSDHDRGQILLVAGLAIAVTLVALVLILNTVIYTQNLAARGTAVEDGAAVDFRTEAAAGVGEAIDAENRAEHGDWVQVSENVTEAVARYDELHSRYPAERATVADIEVETLSLSEGTLLHQTNASRNFASVDGDDDWLLVENVSTVRQFRMTVSGENLSDGDSGAFTMRLESDSDTRTVYIYNDTDDDIAVSNDADGSVPDDCTVSEPEATIDLTEGTVGGSDCSELQYPTDGEYNVSYQNAGEVTGTYEVTVDLPRGDSKVKTDDFGDAASSASPRAVRAVYDAAFDLHFETPTLEFHTRVRVAPGEPE